MKSLKDDLRPFPNVMELLRISTGRKLSELDMIRAKSGDSSIFIAQRDKAGAVCGFAKTMGATHRPAETRLYNEKGELVYALKRGREYKYKPSSALWFLGRRRDTGNRCNADANDQSAGV